MYKLIRSIGFFAYVFFLYKWNKNESKRIAIFMVIILFSFFFYPDLKNLLRDLNLNFFIHIFVLKWLLILFFFLIYRQLIKMDWSFSLTKVYKAMREPEYEKLPQEDKLNKIKNVKEIEESLNKYRDIKKYPKLDVEKRNFEDC